MLQTIRDNSKGTIAKVIVFFIALTFALFGIETVVSLANQPDAPIEVNGVSISEGEIAQAVEFKKQQLKSQFGEQINFLLQNEEILRKGAIEELVDKKVLADLSNDLGQYASTQYIGQLISQDPTFQVAGKFDKEQYVSVLRRAGFAPLEYQAYLKEQINIQNLQMAIGQSEFVTKPESEYVAQLEAQKRGYRYTTLKIADFAKDISVESSEIEAFYKDNADRFMTEEQVSINYLTLSKADLFQDVDVSDDELKTLFDTYKAQSVESEERQVAHILIEQGELSDAEYQSRVELVQKALASDKADFAALAKKYSDDQGSASSGGDLGYNGREIFPKPFEEAMFALAKGAVSAPVKTESGTHFIKVMDIRSDATKSFEEMKDGLMADAKSQKVEIRYAELKSEMAEKAFEYEDLGALAEDLGLQLESSELFGRNGGEGVAQNPKLVQMAFSDVVLVDHQISEPVDLGDKVYLVKLKEHKASELKPLVEVSASIEADIKAEKAKEAVLVKADELMKGLATGESFDMKWTKVELSARNEAANTNPSITNLAFELPKQQLPQFGKVSLPLGDVALVALESVEKGNAEKASEENSRLYYAQVQSTYSAFQETLRTEADIQYNLPSATAEEE